MIINHNMNAINAHRNMNKSYIAQGKSMEKLNSGLRINKAADDAAGLTISEKMRSQIRGLNQASRNAQDGVSLIQTAEGALSESHAITQRLRELAVQSANGTYTDEDRELINQEFIHLKSEIDRIASDSDFSGSKILNGSKSDKIIKSDGIKSASTVGISSYFTVSEKELAKFGEGNFKFSVKVEPENNPNSKITLDVLDNSKFNGNKEYVMHSYTFTSDTTASQKQEEIVISGVKIYLNLNGLSNGDVSFSNPAEKKPKEGVELQVGANQNQIIGFSIDNMRSRELGLGGIGVGTAEEAQDAIKRVDEAISKISEQRGKLGAVQNRLEHAIISSNNTAENLQASESRIRDVDMAGEMMNLTKLNILQQASQSMLAQANQAPQQVLSILK